jgi:hypothetical protein
VSALHGYARLRLIEQYLWRAYDRQFAPPLGSLHEFRVARGCGRVTLSMGNSSTDGLSVMSWRHVWTCSRELSAPTRCSLIALPAGTQTVSTR